MEEVMHEDVVVGGEDVELSTAFFLSAEEL